MAEYDNQASGAIAEDATPAAAQEPSTADIQPAGSQEQGWTEDDLGAVIDARLEMALDRFGRRLYSGIDQRLTTTEQRAARIEAIEGQITDLLGQTKLSQAMVRRALAGELTEADAAALERAHEDQTARTRIEAERDRLKAQLEASRPAPEAVEKAERGMTPQEALQYEYSEIYLPRLEKYARRQGVDPAEIHAQLPRIKAGATPKDWKRWEDQVETLVDSVADRKLKQEQPRVSVPDTLPMPSVQESYVDRLRKDGPMPTAAEIDRETAAWLARNAR